jgi:hypothetical protein
MMEDANKILIDTVYLDNYNYSFEQLKTAYCQILSLREVLNEPDRKFLVEHDNMKQYEVYFHSAQINITDLLSNWYAADIAFKEIDSK